MIAPLAPLFESAPGFDQPLALLKHCHDRIRKQLHTLQKLLAHLPQHGANPEANRAATAIRAYFNQAAHLHHADEEENLLPMLQAIAVQDDKILLNKLLPEILAEHQEMNACWNLLDAQLAAVADGSGNQLSEQKVNHFCAMYSTHMEKEETHLATMAKRIFSAQHVAQLGAAMQARRNPAPPTGK